jgi:hypothetical protein
MYVSLPFARLLKCNYQQHHPSWYHSDGYQCGFLYSSINALTTLQNVQFYITTTGSHTSGGSYMMSLMNHTWYMITNLFSTENSFAGRQLKPNWILLLINWRRIFWPERSCIHCVSCNCLLPWFHRSNERIQFALINLAIHLLGVSLSHWLMAELITDHAVDESSCFHFKIPLIATSAAVAWLS